MNGIDIHPVAVSIARATLLRALPVGSVRSLEELRVWQGDSLMLNRAAASLFNPDNRIIEVPTPQGRQIAVPVAFAESPQFASHLRRLVAAAQSNEALPSGIGNELDVDTRNGISKLHTTLSEVCVEEGDSVWAWYLANCAAPFILARTGVDRIVANPPWVRMSDIQVRERKCALETRIGELGLSAGGKNATGFDIAGLFVDQCREHFLKSESPAAGWVLNWGSMKAGNWSKVRDKHAELTSTYLDLSKVRQPPFTGAKACVWIQRGKPKFAPSTRIYSNRRGWERLSPTDDRKDFAAKTNWVLHEHYFDDEPSDYVKPDEVTFAQGAIITPSVLLKVAGRAGDTVMTAKSRHQPWSQLATQRGHVPEHYVRQTLFSSELLVFGFASFSSSIIPLTERELPDFTTLEDGTFDFSKGNNPFWNQLDELYETHRGRGSATPETLWGQLNFQNKLMKQFDSRSSDLRKVVYNTSGQIMRATRLTSRVIIDSSCYYVNVLEEEAAYMTAILNAPCLQAAFQQSRESDRHFHLHPIRKVPISRYEPNDLNHRELAELCESAEVASQEVIDQLPANTGQIKASKSIRRFLMDEGIADAIDEVVRRVLPSHSVHEYTDDIPHPWR